MKYGYLVSLILILLSTTLFAKDKEYQLSLSAVGMSMDYSEYLDNGELYNTEKSALNDILGLELKLKMITKLEDEKYSEVGVSLMSVEGKTQYTGGIIGSGLGYGSYVGTTYNSILDMKIVYQHRQILKNNLEFTYGIGFGYREWSRALSSTQIEIYSWFSLRPKVGLLYRYKDFSVAPSLEYQYGIFPEMSFDMNGRAIILNLGGANISKFTLPLKYKYSRKLNIFIEYQYERQIIDESNIVDGWLEPRSEAYNQYIKFGAEFKF